MEAYCKVIIEGYNELMAKRISEEEIDRELRELDGKISCNNAYAIEYWARYLPGLSPKDLAGIFRHCPGDMKCHVCFDDGEHGHQGFAKITISEGKHNVQADDPYHLVLYIHPNQVAIGSCNIGRHLQGKHLAKTLLAATRDLALAIDKPSLALHASGKGSYSWAKFGFVPNAHDWQELKRHLCNRHLNTDHTHTQYDQAELGSFKIELPAGVTLTPEETKLIERVLASPDPRDLYLLSDMGRVVGRSWEECDITVGKALLAGLGWNGELSLTEGNPGYERFKNYISPTMGHAKRAGEGSLAV